MASEIMREVQALELAMRDELYDELRLTLRFLLLSPRRGEHDDSPNTLRVLRRVVVSAPESSEPISEFHRRALEAALPVLVRANVWEWELRGRRSRDGGIRAWLRAQRQAQEIAYILSADPSPGVEGPRTQADEAAVPRLPDLEPQALAALREKLNGAIEARDNECPVCVTKLCMPVITHCQHVFCRECIVHWIRTAGATPSCPFCRAPLSEDQLVSPVATAAGEDSGESDGADGSVE